MIRNKKPVLILQFRPENEVSESEFEAFLKYGKINKNDVIRIRAEYEMPSIRLEKYSAVIIGGGPYNVSDKKKTKTQIKVEEKLFQLMKKIEKRDFPYLGNCYGFGVTALACGGMVSKEKYSEEAGAVTIKLTSEGKRDKILQGVKEKFRAFVGHKEACQRLPNGAINLALSKTCPYHMYRLKNNIYAVQFHTELDYEGIVPRIDFYKYHGYFPSEEAENLKEKLAQEKITEPMKILKNFIDIYYKN